MNGKIREKHIVLLLMNFPFYKTHFTKYQLIFSAFSFLLSSKNFLNLLTFPHARNFSRVYGGHEIQKIQWIPPSFPDQTPINLTPNCHSFLIWVASEVKEFRCQREGEGKGMPTKWGQVRKAHNAIISMATKV